MLTKSILLILLSFLLFGHHDVYCQRINLSDPTSIATPQFYSKKYSVQIDNTSKKTCKLISIEKPKEEKETYRYNSLGNIIELAGSYAYNTITNQYIPSIKEEYVYNKKNVRQSIIQSYTSQEKTIPYSKCLIFYNNQNAVITQQVEYWSEMKHQWLKSNLISINRAENGNCFISSDSLFDPLNRKVTWQKFIFDSLTKTETFWTIIKDLTTNELDTISSYKYFFNDNEQLIQSIYSEHKRPITLRAYTYEKNGFLNEEKVYSYQLDQDSMTLTSRLEFIYSTDFSRTESIYYYKLYQDQEPVVFRKTIFYYDVAVPFSKLCLPIEYEQNCILFHHKLNKIEYFKFDRANKNWIQKNNIVLNYN